MQPEESLEKICYGKVIWRVAKRWEEDKDEDVGKISYRDSDTVKVRGATGISDVRENLEDRMEQKSSILADRLETARGFNSIIIRGFARISV